MKNKTINANGTEIRIYGDIANENAYISLTDIAKVKESLEPRIVISNWMSSYSTIDFLALWENIYNPDFNRMEFHTVRNEIREKAYRQLQTLLNNSKTLDVLRNTLIDNKDEGI